MDLKQRLESDLKEAMKASNDVKKRTIRMVLTNLKFAQVEKGAVLAENEIVTLIQKEIKGRRETILEAEKIHRLDIIIENQEEIKVLESYLPEQLSEIDVQNLAKSTITELNAKSLNDMGKVMKSLLPKIQGRAPNDLVSKIVRQLLNG
jgi:uncharacterized protein